MNPLLGASRDARLIQGFECDGGKDWSDREGLSEE